jgi:hypothetical protein
MTGDREIFRTTRGRKPDKEEFWVEACEEGIRIELNAFEYYFHMNKKSALKMARAIMKFYKEITPIE